MNTKFNLNDYVPVNARIEAFYNEHPAGRIVTEVVEHNAEKGFILIKASIFRDVDDEFPAATGHAFEVRSEGYVNKTSYIENAETSAVGRALALAGYEVTKGVASREEMMKVERMSTAVSAPRATAISDNVGATHGPEEATITGPFTKDGSKSGKPYTALVVKTETSGKNINYFIDNKSLTVDEVKDCIGYDSTVEFPLMCMVEVDYSGRWPEIIRFMPHDAMHATG